MEKRDATRVFSCPFCEADTPHTVRAQRDDMFAIVCNQCHMGSLVMGESLRLHHLQWEEELRQILNSLSDWSNQGGGGDNPSSPL
jgi:formate-dependent nitrite reductase cytochrome c552 subunit